MRERGVDAFFIVLVCVRRRHAHHDAAAAADGDADRRGCVLGVKNAEKGL